MIVLVTGYAGSGTSRIAEHLHRHGIPMAVAINAPVPGTDMYITWGDAVYVETFREEILRNPTIPSNTLERRQKICGYKMFRYGLHGNHWGLKSPMLLEHIGEWVSELGTLGEVKLVMTDRSFTDCQESVVRHCASPLLERSRAIVPAFNNRVRQNYDTWINKADVVVKWDAPLDDLMEKLR